MSIVYDMPASDYFADNALGSTSIKTLSDPELSLSDVYYQLHNNVHKAEYDVGTLGHALILENSIEDVITLVPYDSYRTKAAREARDEAYKNGLIPVNESEATTMLDPLYAIRDEVLGHPIAGPLLTGGHAEVSLFWEQNGVPCKGRLDYWKPDQGVAVDLKLLRSAAPNDVRKQISDLGYYLQRVHYMNGVQQLTGFRPDWYWVTVAKEPPYSVNVHQMDEQTDEAAQMRIRYALQRYRQATEAGKWPGYTSIYRQSLTPWEIIKNESLEEQIL